MQTRTCLFIALATLHCPACAPEDELDFRESTGSVSSGGIVFNTHEVDDARFSEVWQPETPLHLGVALAEITTEDHTVKNFKVDGGEIVAVDTKGHLLTTEDLIGSEWQFDSFMTLPVAPMYLTEHTVVDGVPRYVFEHINDKGWAKNCPPGPDGPGVARLLAGFTLHEESGELTPKPGVTYIACNTGATGKAADWGYYDVAVAEDDLEIFETAIRVVRADYCYDGNSHTVPGVKLQIDDIWDVQSFADDFDQDIEAVWGKHGLICRGVGRTAEIPSCADVAPVCHSKNLKDYPDGMFLSYVL